MKKILLLCSMCCVIGAFAQTDSVSLGAGATDMVFYNIATGAKTAASNTDWHLSFSVRPAIPPNTTNQAAAIRINEAEGLRIFRSATQKLNSWNTFDTTGWTGWQQLHNPDTTWTIGALNVNKDFSNAYNYGWGSYAFGPHSVIGDSSIYLIQMPDGGFRKFAILNLAYDTAFNVQFANLDNSGFQAQEIPKKPYTNKSFVYYNLDTRTILDKEPAINAWDMVFLRYNNTTYNAANLTQDMGVLTNDAVQTHHATDAELADNCYTGTDFSRYINAIGKLTNINTDSNAYTLHRVTNPGVYNRIVFTQFDGSYNGMTYFKTNLCALTGINDMTTSSQVTTYPVPASDMLHVTLTGDNETAGTILLQDMSGRLILSNNVRVMTGDNHFTLNTSALQSGNYILSVSSGAGKVNRMVSVVK